MLTAHRQTRNHPNVRTLAQTLAGLIRLLPTKKEALWRAMDPLFSMIVCGMLGGEGDAKMVHDRMLEVQATGINVGDRP
jgi:flagellar motor switch protein FliM